MKNHDLKIMILQGRFYLRYDTVTRYDTLWHIFEKFYLRYEIFIQNPKSSFYAMRYLIEVKKSSFYAMIFFSKKFYLRNEIFLKDSIYAMRY